VNKEHVYGDLAIYGTLHAEGALFNRSNVYLYSQNNIITNNEFRDNDILLRNSSNNVIANFFNSSDIF